MNALNFGFTVEEVSPAEFVPQGASEPDSCNHS
jgi:hypothetical protein